jgi:pimeloyl-ACP methyl ester carboxylesterase
MNPIIYIRGYAGTKDAVENAVDSPYYGFNDGSSRVRLDGKGRPALHLFESPLIRLMREHGFTDYFARVSGGKVDLLKPVVANLDARSIWIFRYYDESSAELGTGRRKVIEELADDLGKLVDFVIAKTGAAKVDLVAHSMGGLVARSLIQRNWQKTAPNKIRRLFTFGTPHGGIHFRGGLGWAELLRDMVGHNQSDSFGLKRMRQFLNLPGASEDEIRQLGAATAFSPDQCFSLIGTNHHDYELTVSRTAVGPGSDGLVMAEKASIKGSNRAFVHRAHSGPYGLVNSEEGYQNLQRFLFGDTAVKVSLRGVKLDRAGLRASRGAILSQVMIESRAALRGIPGYLHYHNREFGSAIPVKAADLDSGETIFRIFLMKAKRSQDDGWSRFQIEIKLLPLFSRPILSDFEGDFLFRGLVEIGIRDPGAEGSREVEWSWKPLDSKATRKTVLKNPEGAHEIELPLQGSQLTAGQLAFEIKPW